MAADRERLACPALAEVFQVDLEPAGDRAATSLRECRISECW
jgi:hypothetical protein